MRLPSILLFAFLTSTTALHAQATPLPPGTSMPDANPAQTDVATTAIDHAESAVMREQYPQAIALLNKALAAKPTSQQTARIFYDRGYIEQEQNQLAAAEANYRKANAANPKQFESHAALGQLLAQQQQWKEARQELEQAATLQPASGNPLQAIAGADRTLARVDVQLHDDSAASDALLAALKLTPEETEDTLLAAQLAEDEKNYTDAAQAYRKVLAADPKSIPAAQGLARALIQERKYSDAEPILQQALTQEPNDPVLLAESATALAGDGKTQQAIPQLETLHRQNPDQPAVTRMLADLYSSNAQAAQAEPLYQQLITGDSRDPDLLTAAAENLLHEQKWPQAVQMFQQSLNIQPQQADAWSGLAFAASEDQQYPLVLSALAQRAQYLPDSAATFFLRATAFDHLHRTNEAIPYYQKFLAAAQGKFPDEESQTRQRLQELQK